MQQSSVEESETYFPNTNDSISNASPQKHSQKKLDIAFLFSDPLVLLKQHQNGALELEEFPRNIDTEGEFYKLMRHLEKSHLNQQIVVKRVAANFLTLRQVIDEKPTILHITCHGDSEFRKEQGRNIYFLAFEDEKMPGTLDKLDEYRLRGSRWRQKCRELPCEAGVRECMPLRETR